MEDSSGIDDEKEIGGQIRIGVDGFRNGRRYRAI